MKIEGMKGMELRVLNYFLAVAREENITKAAQLLHVTQPTVSRQLMQLEEELGVQLFERSNHNIVLTEDGMILKRRAQEILSLADKTKQDFLEKEESLSGNIAIGSGEFLSTSVLSEILSAFHEKYPLVQYSIYSGNGENVRERIERGLLDVGLVTEPVDMRKYHFAPMPVKECWGILVRGDSALAQKEYVQPRDLLHVPLITTATELHRSMIGQWFGAYGDEINIIATGNLLYNQVMLAQSGIGVVVGIKLNCTYEGVRFIPFAPRLEIGTALIWKKEQIFVPAMDAFLKHASSYLKNIACDGQ
jgi:DNA-binding transcriptional LysR family regulator